MIVWRWPRILLAYLYVSDEELVEDASIVLAKNELQEFFWSKPGEVDRADLTPAAVRVLKAAGLLN